MSGAGMSLIFHIGVVTNSDEESEADLRREHEEHRDILQNSLEDNYQNLTRKMKHYTEHRQVYLFQLRVLSCFPGLKSCYEITILRT